RLAAVSAANATAPAGGLLRELMALPSLQSSVPAGDETLDDDRPTRTWEAGLQQLREALSRPRRHSASQSERVATLLDRLTAAHPQALRSRLLQWAGERRQRRLWSQCVAPENLGTLMAAMSPARI